MAETNTKSRQAIYLILILLLLITNAWLFYSVQKMKREKQDVEIAMTTEKETLQEELDGLMEELETFKEENIEMDSTLQSIRIQIDEQTTEIENLLSKNRASRQELTQARTMLETLRSSMNNYKTELDQMKLVNQQLNKQNLSLKDDVVAREETIKNQTDSISQLQLEQEMLNTKASILNEEKELLTSKVNRAAVLQTSSVEIAGVKYRSSGKEVMVHNAKRVEKMKVCFDVMSNPVAPPGQKEIMLRIVSPSGESLFCRVLWFGNPQKFGRWHSYQIHDQSSHRLQWQTQQLLHVLGTKRATFRWKLPSRNLPRGLFDRQKQCYTKVRKLYFPTNF